MPPSPSSLHDSPAKRSCDACKRLKRKCDRRQPCQICQKSRRECTYAPIPIKRTRDDLEAEVRELQQVVKGLAPNHGDVARRFSSTSSPAEPFARLVSNDYGREPSVTRPAFDQSSTFVRQSQLRDERIPNDREISRPASPRQSMSVHHGSGPSISPLPSSSHQPLFCGEQTTAVATTRPVDPANSALDQPYDPSSTTPIARTSDAARRMSTTMQPGPHAHRSPVRSKGTVTTSDIIESQPRSAQGYEWDERSKRKPQDGTASLSIEPDGEGYLGFASGATLLRILQIVSGSISLSHVRATALGQASTRPLPPSYEDEERYIHGYFANYHQQYPLVHEPTFRAQHGQVLPRPEATAWLLLSSAILGLGAFCIGEPMNVVDHYLDLATRGIGADLLEAGSLTLVQGLTLLSNLAQKRNKPNSGSTYLGIAVRMAIGLGLHRELPFWRISPFERESRRRVWWTLFIFDSGACITFGRPILLPYEEADVDLPNNVPDRLFSPSTPELLSVEYPTSYSSLIRQSQFHLLGNRIYSLVISNPPLSVEQIMDEDDKLQSFMADLPEWLTVDATQTSTSLFLDDRSPSLLFSGHKLFWRQRNLRMILHRRSFLDRALSNRSLGKTTSAGDDDHNDPTPMPLEAQSAHLCLVSALDSIEMIHRFFSSRLTSRFESWYGLHFLFQAAFVPLLALHTDPISPDRIIWSRSLELVRNVLESLQHEPLAERCLRIIQLCSPAATSITAPMQADRPPMTTTQDSMLNNMGYLPPGFHSDQVGDMFQTLLPLADLGTLSSLWPSPQ